MASNLFLMVMEAEGDLIEPFDGGGTDAPPDTGAAPEQAPQPDGMDEPPPMADDNGADTLSGFDNSSDDGGSEPDGGDQQDDGSGDQTDDGNANDTKLSDKANAVLNQRLYQQMMDRNQEISDVLENLSKINPVLPYEVIKQNEDSTTKLRAALQKSQDYMLNKFVDSGYGENALFFQKLDALYTILLRSIDANLKKIDEENT